MTDFALEHPPIPLQLDVILRPAQEDDLPHLEWGGVYWKYRTLFRRAYHDQLHGRRLLLLADLNGYPIGQVFIQFTAGHSRFADGLTRAYLYSLRVMPHLRGMGIGTRLLQAAEEEMRQRGFTEATIAVSKKNPGALRLYKRLGYTVFGEDSGRWSYVDPKGKLHRVHDPCWALEKWLGEG